MYLNARQKKLLPQCSIYRWAGPGVNSVWNFPKWLETQRRECQEEGPQFSTGWTSGVYVKDQTSP